MRGGDMIVVDHLFGSHGTDNTNSASTKDSNEVTVSFPTVLSMILHISLSMYHWKLGYYFERNAVLSVVITVAVIALTRLSFHIYFRTCLYGTGMSYAGIWTLVYGRSTRWMANLLVLGYLFSSAYEIAGETAGFIQRVIAKRAPNAPSILSNEWLLTYVLNFITVIPPLYRKDYSRLKWTAHMGNIMLFIGIICVAVSDALEKPEVRPDDNWNWETGADLIAVIQQVCFVNVAIQNLSKYVERPTNMRFYAIVWATGGLYLVLLLGCGFLSAKKFSGFTVSIFEIMDHSRTEVIILEISTLINVLLTESHLVYFMTREICDLVADSNKTSSRMFSGFVALLLILCMKFVPKVLHVLGQTVVYFVSCIIIYILPSLFFMSWFKRSRLDWFAMCLFLLLIGIAITGLITVSNIKQLIRTIEGNT